MLGDDDGESSRSTTALLLRAAGNACAAGRTRHPSLREAWQLKQIGAVAGFATVQAEHCHLADIAREGRKKKKERKRSSLPISYRVLYGSHVAGTRKKWL
jgi:hypothetical protein